MKAKLMALLAWFAGETVVKFLAVFGLGLLTFGAYMGAVNWLVEQAQGKVAAMPLALLQLMTLAGIPEGLGLILAAFTARAVIDFAPRFGRVPVV